MSTIKPLYGTEAAITLTLDALASDSNLLAGRASTVVDNSTNRYEDALVSGKILGHASVAPTTGTVIEVWAYAQYNDTPTYPDGITGTDANKTLTSANVKGASLRPLWAQMVDAATGRTYVMPPTSVAMAFGGTLPKRWGVFVVQNSGQALAASGHELKYVPVNREIV